MLKWSVVLLVSWGCLAWCSDTGPVTQTPSGSVRGSWMTTRRGRPVEAYRGVRYAEPPVGALRFQPPQLILQYDEEVDASSEGPACPQPASEDYYTDEDCLRINLYTPANRSEELLPIVFYMHSGGFYSVSGRSDLAGPGYLLDHDVVLVTINYRLGSLGFLSTGDALAPGNNGFKDQVAALRWLQRNARAFGGDPDRVTISGCSAGSISVMLHMLSPMSKGLFHRAISISGSPVSQVADRSDMYDLAVKQAQLLDCPTNGSQAIIDCLRTKSFKEIGDSLDGFFLPGYDPVLIWSPVIEADFGQERFLTSPPAEAIKQGDMHAVPFIMSQTQGEFFWKAYTVLRNQTILDSFNADWHRLASVGFLLGDHPTAAERLKLAYLNNSTLENSTEIADGLGKLYGDAVIGFGVHRMANLMSRYSPQPVWYYEFGYVGNHSHYEDADGKPEQAAHHDDLIYLFSLPAAFPLINVTDSADSEMVDLMTSMVVNFATNGDPNHSGLLAWPAMSPSSRPYLRIDRQPSLHENLFEDRMQVWEELYPLDY